MRDFNRDPADLFPRVPLELERAQQSVHDEFRRLADIAAGATIRARKVSASGAQPELTEEEQYAIAYVAGVRGHTGIMAAGRLQVVMPEVRIHWDAEHGRFVVEAKE